MIFGTNQNTFRNSSSSSSEDIPSCSKNQTTISKAPNTFSTLYHLQYNQQQQQPQKMAQDYNNYSNNVNNNETPLESFHSAIRNDPVVIYTQTFCCSSIRIKALLLGSPELQNVTGIRIIDVDTLPRAREHIQIQPSLPSVWVHGRYLGGQAELQMAWENGDLAAVLGIDPPSKQPKQQQQQKQQKQQQQE